ncbi:DUF397 domain-containing protein [Streptomyces sp. B1866]|uniref:DUF397 domain-containing protein n=1 Tax=Streptomyces sp. B1866 TaxID=3075431 RepID=UPI00289009C6|nr:DUF397 domain-containing protein [Streptomyces sp. B1866]MDT3395554.1 DUF397 domain-containing protein [Streptomyces sp. B1866]
MDVTELSWQKSSYCQESASCVYVAAVEDGTVKLRESDDPDVVLTASRTALRAFIRAAKAGKFDSVMDQT